MNGVGGHCNPLVERQINRMWHSCYLCESDMWFDPIATHLIFSSGMASFVIEQNNDFSLAIRISWKCFRSGIYISFNDKSFWSIQVCVGIKPCIYNKYYKRFCINLTKCIWASDIINVHHFVFIGFRTHTSWFSFPGVQNVITDTE